MLAVEILSSSIVIIVFILLAQLFGVFARSREAISIARVARSIMADKQLNDEQKEKAIQSFSLQLFGLLAWLLIGIAGALIIPLGGLWLIEQAGFDIWQPTLQMLQSWPFLLGATFFGCIAFVIMRRG